eukprot:1139991-Pelagomonas_calceolata.AAC.2
MHAHSHTWAELCFPLPAVAPCQPLQARVQGSPAALPCALPQKQAAAPPAAELPAAAAAAGAAELHVAAVAAAAAVVAAAAAELHVAAVAGSAAETVLCPHLPSPPGTAAQRECMSHPPQLPPPSRDHAVWWGWGWRRHPLSLWARAVWWGCG